MPSSTRSTAARLLRELLNDGAFTAEGIATRLGVTPTVLDDFRDGRAPVPLHLAVLAMQQAPHHSRVGHNLHGQVLAALRYESGATATHLYDPPQSQRT